MMAEAGPNATILTATDYGQGFGSFHFATWFLFQEARDRARNLVHNTTISTPTSQATEETATPFPFMRLPFEIREKILKCFTDPLLVQNALRRFERQDAPLPPTGTQFWGIKHDLDALAQQGLLQQQGDDTRIFKMIIPNYDTGPSYISLRYGEFCGCLLPTFDDCLQVNNLSKVNRQLTYELGACLWQNAAVTFQTPEHFVEFADSRPVALTFVKGILIVLNCEEDDVDFCPFPNLNWNEDLVTSSPNRTPTLTQEFLRMMQKINDSDIDLNFFRVLLYGSAKYHGSRGFDTEGKISKWAPAFQHLKTRQFDVVPGAITIEDTALPSTPEIGSPRTDTQTEAWKALVSLWKPKSIQERENTKEAVYNRLRDVEEEGGDGSHQHD